MMDYSFTPYVERAKNSSINRLAKEHKDKLVIFENGAFILYQQDNVGYGAMDWCYVGVITYDKKNRELKEEATKKASDFLGVKNIWE